MTACSKLGTLRSLKGLIGVCVCVCKYICIYVYVFMHSEYVRLSDKNCKAGCAPMPRNVLGTLSLLQRGVDGVQLLQNSGSLLRNSHSTGVIQGYVLGLG